MKRGTKVGQAYVAITADGSGINKDIVDDIDGASGDIGKSGDRAGEGYGENFGESLRETLEPIMDKMGDELSKRLNRSVRDGLNSTANNKAANGLGARLGDTIGEAVAERLELQVNSILDTVEAKLQQSGGSGGSSGGGGGTTGGRTIYPSPDPDDRFWQMTLRMNAEFDRQRGLMLQHAAKMDADFHRQRGIMVSRAEKMNEDFDRAQHRMLGMAEKMNEDFDRSRHKMIESAFQMNEDFDRAQGRMLVMAHRMDEDFDRSRHRMVDAAHRMNEDFDRKRGLMLVQAHRMNMLHSKGKVDGEGRSVSGNDSSSFSLDIGKIFGKGSRNNGLNLIGSVVGGLSNMMIGLTKVTAGFVKTFMDGMEEAGKAGMNLFGRMAAGAQAAGKSMGSSMAKAGPLLAGAVILIGFAALSLVAILSALVAIVTALASTIVSALVGAAVVGAGALMAMVAAGGLLTAAFMSMTNAQQDMLKNAFNPLRSAMVGIGQIMLREMVPAFQVWADNLKRALVLLAPVAQVMGSAFAKAGSILTAAFSGPGFQAMSVALGTWLPSIVQRLSRAFGAFLNGTMGLFAAIMPMVNRFAGYLRDVAMRFSTWANSTKGQNAIVDFVNRAVASLQSLWNFTREVFGFIGDLLFSRQAQNAGNSMFDSMTEAFKDFRRAIARAIADGSLQEWFERGAEFGAALWGVIKALYKVFVTLESSGILSAVASSFDALAWTMDKVAWAAEPVVDAIDAIAGAFGNGADEIARWNGQMSIANMLGNAISGAAGAVVDQYEMNNPGWEMPDFNFDDLFDMGEKARNQTFESDGGYKMDPTDEYKNPYVRWAQQFIDSGPSAMQQVKQAVREVVKQFQSAIREASKAIGAGEAKSLISTAVQSAKDAAKAMVENAQSALSSAASTLASAGNKRDAAIALAEVFETQEALARALQSQERIQRAMARLNKQKITKGWRVRDLLDMGEMTDKATLADYAEARERLAAQIEKANQKLVDAIAMRNDYKTAVVDAIKTFGSVLSAQASTIDGIEQALTYTDITTNLRDRLAQIRKFQEDLQKLLAMGLSKDVYKQLVDGGVEQGGAFAAALLEGGTGAVAEVNSLTASINSVGESLGIEASRRLYQSGIEAARGLIDGLEKKSDYLERWAKWLGKTVAAGIANAVNGYGYNYGQDDKNGPGKGKKGGGKNGVGEQSGRVAVSREVAAYAARRGEDGTVSGNDDRRFRDLHVHTPTKNPEAVALEVLNEVTGRL